MSATAPDFWRAAHERSRHLLAIILLHNLAAAGGQDGEEVQQGGAQQQHIKVMSREHVYQALALREGARAAMDFMEELFAVQLPKLLIFALIFGFGLLLAKLLPLFTEEFLARIGAMQNVRIVWAYITFLGVFAAALWIALAAIGINVWQILITFGILTLALTAGFQVVISNTVSAFAIQLTNKTETGQEISVNGVRGIVVEMNLADVLVRLVDGSEDLVYIPNSYLTQFPVRHHVSVQPQEQDVVIDSGSSAGEVPNSLAAMAVRKHKNT